MSAINPDGNEVGGWNEPALWMFPPDECLDRDEAARVQGDHGLVVEDELIALEGSAQIHLEAETFHRRGVHRGVEDLEARAAVLLRAIHGEVGASQQVL